MITTKFGKAVSAFIAGILFLLAAGCSSQAPGDTGTLKALAATCPKNHLQAYVADDISGSSTDPTVDAARAATIKAITTKVAVCTGHLRIVVFTSSAAASRIVFDQDLKPAGATQIAQLRKVPALVQSTTDAISSAITAAAPTISPNGSDITAQFGLAAQFAEQITGTFQLTVDILTDGVQTTGVVLNTKDLTVQAATDLGNTAPVTALPPTATVKVSGLGKTAGTPAPTSFITAEQAFYLTYCQRTGAASCVAVTDYTAES